MLMVIFGAGASYDSLDERDKIRPPDLAFRPPLAKELFQKRQAFDSAIAETPEASPIVAMCEHAVARGEPIERYLAHLQDEADKHKDFGLVRQLRALRFYIRDVVRACEVSWPYPGGRATNYGLLLEQIRRWQARTGEGALYVTFNYDTLLDQACLATYDVSFPERGMESYIEFDAFRLIKLHGSTD
jgi:hypothetical protein